MGYPVLTSRNNEKIKEFVKFVGSKSARRVHNRFTLEGLRLCADAAQSGFAMETVFVTEAALSKDDARMKALLSACSEVYLVTDAVAEKLSDTVTPQGVFCVAIPQKMPAFKAEQGKKYVLLDAVQNPQNLGAIARTAEAFGVDAILYGGGCDRYNPKALRASMGSLLRLPIYEVPDLAQTVLDLGKVVPTFATVPDAQAEDLCAQDFTNGAAMIIGNEGNGITDAVLENAQKRVTIRMRGNAESLNAAAAATVSIWEMMK